MARHCLLFVAGLSVIGCAASTAVQRAPEPAPTPVIDTREADSLSVGRPRGEITHDAIARPKGPRERGELVAGFYQLDGYALSGPPRLAVTLDDGPHRTVTPAVMNILERHSVKATFFLVGRAVRREPGIVRALVAAGHDIGSHTYAHESLPSIGFRRAVESFERTQRAVNDALGTTYPLHLTRPPYGAPWMGNWTDRQTLCAWLSVRAMASTVVLWNIASGDTGPTETVDSIVSRVLSMLLDGRSGVLVMHDTTIRSAQALDRILTRAKAMGYAFPSAKSLIEAKYGSALASLTQFETLPQEAWTPPPKRNPTKVRGRRPRPLTQCQLD